MSTEAPQPTEISHPGLKLVGKLALARLNDLPEVSEELRPVVENTLASFQTLASQVEAAQPEPTARVVTDEIKQDE